MNIFLPYEDNVIKSVEVLDNCRLIKQILETKQLLLNALHESWGDEIKGYKNHPVYVHFKGNIPFLVYYGYIACQEYQYRFGKTHELFCEFSQLLQTKYTEYVDCVNYKVIQPPYTPYYMEGSKGQPNYIRTTENVGNLFKQKLIKKWENDKAKGRPPKWTNREVPQFYQDFMKGEQK